MPRALLALAIGAFGIGTTEFVVMGMLPEMAEGPQAGLAIADRLPLEGYRYLHSARGEMLRRLGRTEEAGDAYRRAIALAGDGAERRLLERRLAEITGSAGS